MEYIFETEHLKIRKFETEDAKCLYENHLEEEVKRWMPNESYVDLEETQEAIKFYADCVNGKHLPYVLAVELKETGELIGDTGVNEVDGNPDEVEIGYGICKKYSGNGYATELLKAMTEFITRTFGINILYGRVMRGNNASVRVLEKNGYVFVKEEFGAEDDPYGNGMLIYKKAYMIRQADKQDIPRIAEIIVFGKRVAYRPIFQNDYGSFNELQVVHLYEEYQNNPDKLKGMLLYDDGIVKGVIKGQPAGDKTVEITDFYVDPFFVRQGIGTLLIEYLMQQVKQRGGHKIVLWVIKDNRNARRFYEANGFVNSGKTCIIEGTAKEDCFYECVLA